MSQRDRALTLGAILVALVLMVALLPPVFGGHDRNPSKGVAASTAPNQGPNPNVFLPRIVQTAPSRPPAARTGGGDAIAYQVDVAHDGNARDANVQLPLSRAWVRKWNGAVSYPLIADGMVFVAVDQTAKGSGKAVYALDSSTGQTLWTQAGGGPYGLLGMAFDAGRLFVVNSDGLVVAYDATSGAPDWSAKMPVQWFFTSPPTAWGGQLYVGGAGSGGTLYAVDETTGTVRWTQTVVNGDHSSPILFGTKVAVGYVCFQIRAFDAWKGTMAWNDAMGCDGGGGRTMAYEDGKLYARDDASPEGMVLDASTGHKTATFASTTIPAFDGSTGYFLEDGTLRARDLSTMEARWSFAGDGMLVSAPLVVGGQVFVASSIGHLYELGSDGRLVDSFQLGVPVTAPDEHNSVILSGMNAGDGILAVAAEGRLVAFH